MTAPSFSRLQHLAPHDSLTDLPNRLQFDDALERTAAQARRHHRRLALMYIGLDRFQHINDTLGHAVGEQVLQTTARRLQTSVRAQDAVARLDGDEFTVLVTDAGAREEVAHLADKLIGILSEPVWVEGRSLALSASMGIALFPDDADTPDGLFRAVDAALRRAKANGRPAFSFYTEALTQQANERLALEKQLRGALQAAELRLHYQPRVSRTGELEGFEALLRWQHPTLGLLLPGRFLHAIEQSSLSQAIGEWVLLEASRQARQWLNNGLRPGCLAINLSGRQFIDERFVTVVQEALKTFQLDNPACGARLQLEMPESVLQAGGGRSTAILQALHGMGVDVVIDNFRNGHFCLRSLKDWPLRAWKIDAACVRGLPEDPDSRAIVQAMVAMARPLGLAVVAAGVETAAQRDCLLGFGCDALQGYLIGKPMAPESAAALLRAESSRRCP